MVTTRLANTLRTWMAVTLTVSALGVGAAVVPAAGTVAPPLGVSALDTDVPRFSFPRQKLKVVIPTKSVYDPATRTTRIAEAMVARLTARARNGRVQVLAPGLREWVAVPYRYDGQRKELVYDEYLRRAYGMSGDPLGAKRPKVAQPPAVLEMPDDAERAVMDAINTRRQAAGQRPLVICQNVVAAAHDWARRSAAAEDGGDSIPDPTGADPLATTPPGTTTPRVFFNDAFKAVSRYGSSWKRVLFTTSVQPGEFVVDRLSAESKPASDYSFGSTGYLDAKFGEHLGAGRAVGSDGREYWTIIGASGGTCQGPLD